MAQVDVYLRGKERGERERVGMKGNERGEQKRECVRGRREGVRGVKG